MAERDGNGADDPLTLAEAMTSKLVLCDFCERVYQNPVLLPCLHTFCRRCIVAMVTKEETPLKTSTIGVTDQRLDTDGRALPPRVDRVRGRQQTLQCPTCHATVTLVGGKCAVTRKDDATKDEGDDNDDDRSNATDEDSTGDEDQTDDERKDDERKEDEDEGEGGDEEEDNEEIISDGDPGQRKRQRKPERTSQQPKNGRTRATSAYVTATDKEQENSGDRRRCEKNEKTAIQNGKTIGSKQLKAVENTVRDSLPSNHFLDSLARLYSHRNGKGRQCAYCKTDGLRVDATSLCLQCQDNVCDSCTNAHRKTRVTRGHRVVPFESILQGLFDHDIRDATSPVPCSDHPQSPTSHFCSECLVVVCKSCRSGNHYGHRLFPLAEAVSKFMPEMDKIREALKRSSESLSEYAQFLSKQIANLEVAKNAAMEEIELQTKSITAMIEERRMHLCSQVEEEYDEEVSDIKVKIVNACTSEHSTAKSASLLRHLGNLGRSDEQMSMYAHVLMRHKELVSSRLEVVKSRLRLQFYPGPKTDTNVSILLGKLETRRVPLNEQEGLKNQSLLSSLMPTTICPPLLIGAIDDSSIKGMYPSGLDTKDNMLAVVDRENQMVKVFDLKTLRLYKEFGGGGATTSTNPKRQHIRFQKPFDVAFLPNGVLAISDPEAGCVSMYEWTGKFIANFKGDMKHPRGITLNKEGEVVVVDGHLRRVTVHDATTGVMLRTIHPHQRGKTANHPNEILAETDAGKLKPAGLNQNPRKSTQGSNLSPPVLIDPFYIHVTDEGNMVISDAASPNLKILNPDGMLLAETMDYGTGPDQNLHPSGVCVDKYGYILVADTNNSRVHLGLPDGQMTETPLLSPSEGLSHPVSLCLTQQGHLVIGQSGGHIKLYKYVS